MHTSFSSSEIVNEIAAEFQGNEERTSKELLFCLPSHSHNGVEAILRATEKSLRGLHHHSLLQEFAAPCTMGQSDMTGGGHEIVFANSYTDLGKIDIVGFDYDYTLITYKEELLDLIYSMALKRLVTDRQYPLQMMDNPKMKFDPSFSIRGLAVDKETGWICHLSYTHKVAVAWEGREKVSSRKLFEEYRGKRALRPSERRQRIKPLNDLFSMAECCLIADTVQFFKDNDIPFCPRNAVNDILRAIGDTHISGDFHRLVAQNPSKYIRPTPYLKQVLQNLKNAQKSLIFVSNSPFWYVDAGMKFVIGEDWRDDWDAVITSAGKPSFYTNPDRPFREVCLSSGRIKFDEVVSFEKGRVYTEGCLKELTRFMNWNNNESGGEQYKSKDALAGGSVLYVGDSLFADLVDAKREFGWTTAAVTPEVGFEMELQSQSLVIASQRSIKLLLNALRLLQVELGTGMRTDEDLSVLDSLEKLVSKWRDHESRLMGNPFGSVFRARYQPSLFAHSLRRYSDLYMSSVSSLRHYSPQHRFYPEDSRLLSHEMMEESICWDIEDVLYLGDESDI
jgi:HAD superfamily 5'-nucleotidase-like hydrolase